MPSGGSCPKDLTGRAEIWLDHQRIGTKSVPDPASFTVPIPVGDDERKLNVLLETQPGKEADLGGGIFIEKSLLKQ